MKTLKQKLQEGYKLPRVLDDTTKDMIKEWFGLRYCPPHFDEFFERDCNLWYPYFKEQLRIDPSVANYDWFVESYMEREQLTRNTNEQNTAGESATTRHGTIDVTRTNNGTSTQSSQSDSANSGATRNVTQTRQNPMSASYTSANENEFAGNLNVANDGYSVRKPAQYIAAGHVLNPTMTNDNFVEDDNVAQSKNTGTQTDSHTQTSNDVIDTSNSKTDQSTVLNNGAGRVREIATGRHQLPSSVVSGAIACIQNSESFKWFMRKLDLNFMAIYNIDEYNMEDLDYE